MVEDTSDTVDVDGIECPLNDLQLAFESYDGKTTKRGPVILTPDGYDDTDILVVNLQAGTYRHIDEGVIEEALKDASKQSFVEYVRENVTVATEEEITESEMYDATIVDSDNQWVTSGTFNSIRDDDGIMIMEVEYTNDSNELQIMLQDTRDTEADE